MLQNSQEHTCCRVSIFNNIVGPRPVILFKKDSDTDVFLWILQNF